MTTTCTRRIQFCCGHRVYGHETKCNNLHGHNYVALIEARAQLDHLGRVIDFGVLKERIGGWIDANWDHKTVLCERDPLVPLLHGAGQGVFVMPENPTAECMAAYLLRVCQTILTEVEVVSVRLWETENCYAEVRV